MTYGRARRLLMRWERYHHRFPTSGAFQISQYGERLHNGHAKAWERTTTVGRGVPVGIRRPPWDLRCPLDPVSGVPRV